MDGTSGAIVSITWMGTRTGDRYRNGDRDGDGEGIGLG
jgi:hypothetical protein